MVTLCGFKDFQLVFEEKTWTKYERIGFENGNLGFIEEYMCNFRRKPRNTQTQTGDFNNTTRESDMICKSKQQQLKLDLQGSGPRQR